MWGLLTSSAFILSTLLSFQSGAPKPSAQNAAAWTKAKPILTQNCLPCHKGKDAPSGFRLDTIQTAAQAGSFGPKWRAAIAKLENRQMPPPGSPVLKEASRTTLISNLKTLAGPAPKQRVTMRRLNRYEYSATVRDLLGIEFDPSDDFPNDDVGYGFDNNGDVLSISPLLMEKYLDAAEKAAQHAIVIPPKISRTWATSELLTDTGVLREEGAVGLFTNGAVYCVPKSEAGNYRIRITAFGHQAGPDPCRMDLRINGKRVETFEVRATIEKPLQYEAPVSLPEGKSTIAAVFTNDYYNPNDPNTRNRDRNLLIVSIEVIGPMGAGKPLPMSHRKIITTTPTSSDFAPAAKQVLAPFLRRAWRRPVAVAEVDRLASLVTMAQKEGESFEKGIQLAVQAALCSPHFLFRVESSPNGAIRPLNSHELATRLSYFLWGSTPDEALFSLADSGQIKDPKVLRDQALRMLADPKAGSLTQNFAGQWLQLRKLENANPDPALFPEFTPDLRKDMKKETEAYFEYVLRQNRPIGEFLDSNYSFLNGRLAEFYEVSDSNIKNFAKVTLPNRRRGGLLTQASILTITSNPNRTSPVKRGKWVLEQILGTPPPPPPPGVDALPEDQAKAPSKSIKERLAFHRRKPECAVCHIKMDAIGYAFENYNAIGKWREKDGAFPIEAGGSVEGLGTVQNAADLRAALLKNKVDFVRSFTEKLMVYGLGRALGPSDQEEAKQILSKVRPKDYLAKDLIIEICLSPAFQRT